MFLSKSERHRWQGILWVKYLHNPKHGQQKLSQLERYFGYPFSRSNGFWELLSTPQVDQVRASSSISTLFCGHQSDRQGWILRNHSIAPMSDKPTPMTWSDVVAKLLLIRQPSNLRNLKLGIITSGGILFRCLLKSPFNSLLTSVPPRLHVKRTAAAGCPYPKRRESSFFPHLSTVFSRALMLSAYLG